MTGSSLVPTDSVTYYNPTNKTIDIGLTRTDKTDKLCNGFIAKINIILIDNLPADHAVLLNAVNGSTILANEQIQSIESGAVSINSNAQGIPSNNNMTPYTQVTHEQCETKGEASITIQGGLSPYSIQWSTGATSTSIENLQAGSYTVSVVDANGLTEIHTVEVEYNYIPIYDENGEPIDCNPVTTCPPTITLINTIDSNTYEAGAHILSDGIIPTGNHVIMNAGQQVDLQAGFCVEIGATLSINMEGCNE